MPAKAAEHRLALAEIFRLKGDAASAKKYEDEAEQHVPGSARPAAKAAAPRPRPHPLPRVPPPRALRLRSSRKRSSRWETRRRFRSAAKRTSRSASTSRRPRLPPPPADEESLDLDQELAGGQDIPSPFIDEEPAAAAAEEDVSIGFDEATLDAPSRRKRPRRRSASAWRTSSRSTSRLPRPATPPARARQAGAASGREKGAASTRSQAGPGRESGAREARATAARCRPAARRGAAEPSRARSARAAPSARRSSRCGPLPSRQDARRSAHGTDPRRSHPPLEEVESVRLARASWTTRRRRCARAACASADHPVLLQKIAELGLDESAPGARSGRVPAESDLASGARSRVAVTRRLRPLGHLADDVASEPEPSEAERPRR